MRSRTPPSLTLCYCLAKVWLVQRADTLFGLGDWRPLKTVWCLVATMLPHSYPGHAARVSKRICQTVYPVMCSEEALARGWRGELYVYEALALFGAWKVRRTISARVRYISTIVRSGLCTIVPVVELRP